ncbi:MAG: outer membrane lipoprotein-sorting protein [Thermoanaerobaculia bacterium]
MSRGMPGPARGTRHRGRRRGAGLPHTIGLTALLAIAIGSVAGAADGDAARDLLLQAEASRMPFDEGRVELRIGLDHDGAVEWSGEIELFVERPHRALAVFRSGRQAGRRVLGIDGDVWLLVPNARNPLAVTGQQRLAGTASLADLAGPPLSALYDARLLEEGVLALTARADARAPYPEGTFWIDPATGLPQRIRFRLPSGKEAREVRFTAFREEGGRTLVERMELEDLLGRRERTAVLEFASYEAGPVEDAWLTLEGARSAP